jgi:hypothetical protein
MDPGKIAYTENLEGGGGYPSFLTRVLDRKRNLRRDPLKAQIIRTGTKLSRSQERLQGALSIWGQANPC